jgi:ribosomal protein S6--L-glutamate ligase
MRIGILSRKGSLYSTSRLRGAAEERGHNVSVIDFLRCSMGLEGKRASILYRGEQVKVDAVIPRIGASVTFYGTAVVRQFETMGIYTLASSDAIGTSRDKLCAHQILSRARVDLPVTAFARSLKDTNSVIDMVGGAPLVIKLHEGTQGAGVVLAETKKAAESVIEAFRQLNANILVQEFVKEAGGSDVRCIVVGGRVVAAMIRHSAPGDFRSNLHRGGSAEVAKLTTKERRTAVKAAKALGLNVAGVDLLRSERGPLVLEVNSSPGLEGIEKTTGVDVASEIIEFVENHADDEQE